MNRSHYENFTLIAVDHVETALSPEEAHRLLTSKCDGYMAVSGNYIIQRPLISANLYPQPPAFIYRDCPRGRRELIEWYYKNS